MNDTIIRTTEEIPEAKLVEICREHLPDISKRTGGGYAPAGKFRPTLLLTKVSAAQLIIHSRDGRDE